MRAFFVLFSFVHIPKKKNSPLGRLFCFPCLLVKEESLHFALSQLLLHWDGTINFSGTSRIDRTYRFSNSEASYRDEKKRGSIKLVMKKKKTDESKPFTTLKTNFEAARSLTSPSAVVKGLEAACSLLTFSAQPSNTQKKKNDIRL